MRVDEKKISVDDVLDALDDIEGQLKLIQAWARRVQETTEGKDRHG
jgi:predicted RNA-binding protein